MDTVVVNGEIVVEGRRIEGVDLSNLCFQVQHTAEGHCPPYGRSEKVGFQGCPH